MKLPILTAVANAGWEADLVAALERGTHSVAVVRRCVDIADLLAAAASGTARAVVLSADLRRLDREVLEQLAAARVAVVGLVEPGDDAAERTLSELGVRHILPTDATTAVVTDALHRAVAAGTEPSRGIADPRTALPDLPDSQPRLPALPGPGAVLAVWGPTGAPGRTTVAIGLADETARLGLPTLLIDADTYGGVIGQALGLLDEAPGLAAAARTDAAGRLDVRALASHARTIGPRLRVLTGIGRPDRWPEIRANTIASVLRCARSLAALTVVDCGFCLEQDEEISFDTAVPRRNGVTLDVLETADIVVAVGSADPVGVQRLIRGLAELGGVMPAVQPRVVVNRLRNVAVPGDPRREVSAALARFAGVERADFLPYDRLAADRALANGRTLAEACPGSELRVALAALAADLAGAPKPSKSLRRPFRFLSRSRTGAVGS
jgi:Flp pilus assembly CpaE family ATPase